MNAPIDERSNRLKRIADVVFASLGLALCSGLLLVLALCVKLTSRGPVFYKQKRIGWQGRPFSIYKFRTMVVNADRMGPGVTAGDDPRITRVGRFLRRTKLDELPQLLNVLKGEMSVVGPRPEAPRYVAHYTPEQREVLRVRPGITGPTQLAWRNEEEILRGVADVDRVYIEEILPAKLASDLEYARSAPSLKRDLQIIWQTVAAAICSGR